MKVKRSQAYRTKDHLADIVYYQGHAFPGMYARSYLEGRFDEQQLHSYRKELSPEGGLSSYPHPRLMKKYWQFPSVSMGLSPIMAIYQTRYNKYLINRGRINPNDQKVWAFLGDGSVLNKLLPLVEEMSDEEIVNLRRGGHDPLNVYGAYLSASKHKGAPSVILAQTVKGYGLGEAGEGRNITHQQKKLNEEELKQLWRRREKVLPYVKHLTTH